MNWNEKALERRQDASAIAAGVMNGVFAWMTLGLGITGLTGYMLTMSPQFLSFLYSTPFVLMGAAIAQVVVVLVLSLRLQKMSAATATAMYLFYSLLSGVTFSVYFLAYQLESIGTVFGVTAASFGGMALFGYTTRKNLGALGTFLSMALIGLLIAMLVNLFFRSPMIDLALSAIGVLLFAGLTAFDVQRIKEMAMAGIAEEGGSLQKFMVMGALKLYLDFINMFIFLLRLFGNRR